MIDFEAGKRKFKKGEVVFFGKGRFGTIQTYWGAGKYRIDLYTTMDRRVIDGIPIAEVDCSKEYPLPKNWSYDTELFKVGYLPISEEIVSFCYNNPSFIRDAEKIKRAIKAGYIVKISNSFNGYIDTEIIDKKFYRLKRCYNNVSQWDMEVELHENEIFRTFDEAMQYYHEQDEQKKHRMHVYNSLSPQGQALYDISKYLERRIVKDHVSEIIQIIRKIAETKNLPIENAEVRKLDGYIWLSFYDNQWEKIYEVKEEKEYQPTEKYYAHVYLVGDLDRKPVYQAYTNEDPEEIFKRYNDATKYVLCIGNREWSIDKGLEIPARYELGVSFDSSNRMYSVLVAVYVTSCGSFQIAEGKLKFFDISLGQKINVSNFGVSILANTSLSEKEIEEKVKKRLKNEMGNFAPLFIARLFGEQNQ